MLQEAHHAPHGVLVGGIQVLIPGSKLIGDDDLDHVSILPRVYTVKRIARPRRRPSGSPGGTNPLTAPAQLGPRIEKARQVALEVGVPSEQLAEVSVVSECVELAAGGDSFAKRGFVVFFVEPLDPCLA